MNRPADLAAPAAAAAVVLAAVLGGGFYPGPRMVVGCALIGVWVLAAAGTNGRPDLTEWLLGGLVGWGLVSAIRVGSSPLAAKETLTIWITACLLFGICRRGNDGSRRRALGLLTVGAAGVAAAVVVEASRNGLRVGGLLENPNVAVALLAPTLPLGWCVLDRWPRWRWAWSILVVAGIVCTGSRAGLLATVVAVGFLLPRGRIRVTGLAAGSVMVIGVLVWRFVSQPDVLAWHRISIWWAVIKVWLTRPLTGIGPGRLAEAATVERILHPDEIGRYQFVIGYAESTPLAILVQLGLVGVVLSIVAFGFWWTAERKCGGPSRALVACLAALGTLGLFHDFLTIDPVLWWWVVLVGGGGCMAGSTGETGEPVGLQPLRWSTALVMIWVTAWGIVSPSYAKWMWQRHEPTAEHVVRTMRVEPWFLVAPAGRVQRLLADPAVWTWSQSAEAVHWARMATDMHPGSARGWADLGRVRLRVISDLGGTDHDVVSARRALTRACELDPRLPWHWLERARLERLTGTLDEAVRLTRHALRQEPYTVRGWLFLSRIELEAGDIDSSRATFEEALVRMARTRGMNLNEYEQELVLAPENQLQDLRLGLGLADEISQ